MTRPFHLGWFLQGSSVQAWGEPWTGHIGRDWMVPELFTDMARSLERACFDYLLIEDSSYVGESYGGSTELYLKHGIAVPRQDPSVVASLMSQVTSRIGIVPTFGTYAYPPYLLARLVATLDQVTSGRIGWNAITGSSDFAAMNFGLPGMPEHDLRYDMADEYMEVCQRLWASWEPDAIVADRHSGVLVDHTKVHAVNFEGRFFKTRGPLNSGPCPQGQPVIAQAGGSPRGRQFASRYADTIVAHTKGIAAMKAYRDDVRARMVKHGRDPDSCKVLFLVAPMIGETETEAQDKKSTGRSCGGDGAGTPGASRQGKSNIDFGRFDIDKPLPDDVTTNGHQQTLEEFRRKAAGRSIPGHHGGSQRDRALHRVGWYTRLDGRPHGRNHGGSRRRRLFVFHAQRQSAHAGRGGRRFNTGVAGAWPDARAYTHAQFRDNLLEF